MNKHTLIYADPPWTYRDTAKSGERGAGFKYSTMTVADICRLPVWDLAADSCLLAMWWVDAHNVEQGSLVITLQVRERPLIKFQSSHYVRMLHAGSVHILGVSIILKYHKER